MGDLPIEEEIRRIKAKLEEIDGKLDKELGDIKAIVEAMQPNVKELERLPKMHEQLGNITAGIDAINSKD